MKWYWIILMILGYYLIWSVATLIYYHFEKDRFVAKIFGMLWPITIPITLLILPFIVIDKLLDKYD